MTDPSNPLDMAVWQRGARLGLVWVVIFFGVTALLYLLMGALGWSGITRALCAMGLGPVIALGVIAVWWWARRPALLSPADEGADGGQDRE